MTSKLHMYKNFDTPISRVADPVWVDLTFKKKPDPGLTLKKRPVSASELIKFIVNLKKVNMIYY